MYIHVYNVHTCVQCTYMCTMYVHVYNVCTCVQCTYMCTMYVHVYNVHDCVQCTCVQCACTYMCTMQTWGQFHFVNSNSTQFHLVNSTSNLSIPIQNRSIPIQFHLLSRPGGVARHRDYIFTLRNTFRKVYWSPRSVCLFVCLSVFKGSTGRTACPIVLISFAEDVFWTRDNAELFFLTIGQRARSRSPLLWKSDNGHNFWTGSDRDFWWGAKRSLYNSASARASMLRRTTSRFYITWL